MRSVVASHGPGSNPRAIALLPRIHRTAAAAATTQIRVAQKDARWPHGRAKHARSPRNILARGRWNLRSSCARNQRHRWARSGAHPCAGPCESQPHSVDTRPASAQQLAHPVLAKSLPSVALLARRRRPLVGRHAHPLRMSSARLRVGRGRRTWRRPAAETTEFYQKNTGSDTTVGDLDPPPGEAAEEQRNTAGRRSIQKTDNTNIVIHRAFKMITLLALVPGSNRNYKNPALLEPQCKMTVLPLNSGKPRTCVTLNGSGIQLAVGPQPLWLRNHNSGLAQRIMVKRLATSPHDTLGITDSACKNQSVVVSVRYGPFNPYIPIRSTTIGIRHPRCQHLIKPTSGHAKQFKRRRIRNTSSLMPTADHKALHPKRCVSTYQNDVASPSVTGHSNQQLVSQLNQFLTNATADSATISAFNTKKLTKKCRFLVRSHDCPPAASRYVLKRYYLIAKRRCITHSLQRAIKDRIARPVYQLANHLNQPLYQHGVSIGEIIWIRHPRCQHLIKPTSGHAKQFKRRRIRNTSSLMPTADHKALHPKRCVSTYQNDVASPSVTGHSNQQLVSQLNQFLTNATADSATISAFNTKKLTKKCRFLVRSHDCPPAASRYVLKRYYLIAKRRCITHSLQ
ncbi:hypothetical protein F511_41594 [Dorcoceras hygrometricum]|uniref:Uncharacterized protein n=1 Tax=Dorcoceras hygrometricum TaxID=472368 RepID=A0A2Z7D838_9LAMI|nr:hypothetical protein F511_41594 [Dorcoceras hygrometricum]